MSNLDKLVTDVIDKITRDLEEPPEIAKDAHEDAMSEEMERRKADLSEFWWSGYLAGWGDCQNSIRLALLRYYEE